MLKFHAPPDYTLTLKLRTEFRNGLKKRRAKKTNTNISIEFFSFHFLNIIFFSRYFWFVEMHRTSNIKDGTIKMNGRDRNISQFRKLSAYIMQDNQLHGNLTVEEAMTVAANLKLSAKVSKSDKNIVVSIRWWRKNLRFYSNLEYVVCVRVCDGWDRLVKIRLIAFPIVGSIAFWIIDDDEHENIVRILIDYQMDMKPNNALHSILFSIWILFVCI